MLSAPTGIKVLPGIQEIFSWSKDLADPRVLLVKLDLMGLMDLRGFHQISQEHLGPSANPVCSLEVNSEFVYIYEIQGTLVIRDNQEKSGVQVC